MSRAFTKEPDADAPIALPERPVSGERNIVTLRGLQMIEKSVEDSQANLAIAQKQDDKMEIAKAMRDLEYWQARRDSAELVEAVTQLDHVKFGTKVTIENESSTVKTYCIVGIDEADPANGKLSYVSPLARILIGKKIGDFVETETAEFEILKIEPC